MSSTLTYAAIFVVLFVFATVQVLIERMGFIPEEPGETLTVLGTTLGSFEMYVAATGIIVVLSFVKAGFVAGWYQHLVDEPRSVTYLYLTGLLGALALTVAAAYSIV